MAETLIQALNNIPRNKLPDDPQIMMRILHRGYAEITFFKTVNALGETVVERYWLTLTDAGRALIEDAER